MRDTVRPNALYELKEEKMSFNVSERLKSGGLVTLGIIAFLNIEKLQIVRLK